MYVCVYIYIHTHTSLLSLRRVLNERSDKAKFGFHANKMSKPTGRHKNLKSPDSIYRKTARSNLIYIGGVVQKDEVREPGDYWVLHSVTFNRNEYI